MRALHFACCLAILLAAASAVERQGLLDFIPKGPGRPPTLSSLVPPEVSGSSTSAPAPVPAPAPAPAPAPIPAPAPVPVPGTALVPATAPTTTAPATTAPNEEPAPATPTPVAEQIPGDKEEDGDGEDDESEEDKESDENEATEEDEEAEEPPASAPAPVPAPAAVPAPAPVVDVVTGSGEGYFPCHSTKGNRNDDVACSRVEIPTMLCKRCPLRPVTSRGQFERCDNIFDINNDSCKDAMREYVDLNGHCDHVRASAVEDWLSGDSEAAEVVDYFLYSVCELCCDCVPMGASFEDYKKLSNSHSDSNPTLWDAERGNCPAHAQYDLCNVLPHVTYFTSPGGDEQIRSKACPGLNAWLNSERSSDWQSDPDTSIDGDTKAFLNGALSALSCHRAAIWNNCYNMENLQNHIAIPGGSTPEAPPETFAENEEMLEEDTSSLTGNEASESNSSSDDGNEDETTASSTDASEGTSSANDEASNSDGLDTKDGDSEDPAEDGDEDAPVTVGGQENGAYGSKNPANSEPDASSEPAAYCFPATATVELEDGSYKEMQHLRIGDRVRVSPTSFSGVFMFSHRDHHTSNVYYIQIISSEASVTMTAGHYLQVLPQTGRESPLTMPAEKVKVGDRIQTSLGYWVPVTAVSRVSGVGLYNPHTPEGTIAVDGILTSTYTQSVKSGTAHALLTPLRLLYSLGLVNERSLGSFLSHGVSERARRAAHAIEL